MLGGSRRDLMRTPNLSRTAPISCIVGFIAACVISCGGSQNADDTVSTGGLTNGEGTGGPAAPPEPPVGGPEGTGRFGPPPVRKAGASTKPARGVPTSRTYVLHVPARYDGSKPVPLVVDFHPLGGSGPSERSGSPYPAQTDADGVIMAFPSGLSGPSGGAWNVGPCCVTNVDDVAFARALVADVEKVA